MLKRSTIVSILLLIIAGNTHAQAPTAQVHAAPVDTSIKPVVNDTLQLHSPGTIFCEEIEELSLDEDPGETVFDSLTIITDDEKYPAHALYNKIWTSSAVNPYNIRLVDMPDTVAIDISSYYHPMRNRVTSNFGFRRWRYHYGIDLKLNRGDSVHCSFDGMVRIAQRSRTYGYYVVVRHYNGLETTYAHLSKLLVSPNQEIKAGELVGWGGNTGRSTGPHLHYEVRYLGVPINPVDIINFENYTVLNDTLQLSARHFNYIKEIEKIRVWTVRKGDSLGRIAQRTGVSIRRLCRLNNITTKSILRIGQKIRYT